jgi:hypothetical protein
MPGSVLLILAEYFMSKYSLCCFMLQHIRDAASIALFAKIHSLVTTVSSTEKMRGGGLLGPHAVNVKSLAIGITHFTSELQNPQQFLSLGLVTA